MNNTNTYIVALQQLRVYAKQYHYTVEADSRPAAIEKAKTAWRNDTRKVGRPILVDCTYARKKL